MCVEDTVQVFRHQHTSTGIEREMLVAVYSPILEEAAATLGICVKEITINFKLFPKLSV